MGTKTGKELGQQEGPGWRVELGRGQGHFGDTSPSAHWRGRYTLVSKETTGAAPWAGLSWTVVGQAIDSKALAQGPDSTEV